jgi:hypothetical protein
MNRKMLKIITTLCLTATYASATGQYRLGFQGGVGVSDYVGKDFLSETKTKTGIVASFFYEYEVNLTLSFATELCYEQKGAFYKHIPREATELYIDTRASYITVPIIARFYFGKKAEFYINTGVSASRLIDYSMSQAAYEYGYKILYEPFFNFKLNNWDASVIAGFGFNVYDFLLDIRYHHGIANIYKGENSPVVRNYFLSATLGYTLYKRRVERCFFSR